MLCWRRSNVTQGDSSEGSNYEKVVLEFEYARHCVCLCFDEWAIVVYARIMSFCVDGPRGRPDRSWRRHSTMRWHLILWVLSSLSWSAYIFGHYLYMATVPIHLPYTHARLHTSRDEYLTANPGFEPPTTRFWQRRRPITARYRIPRIIRSSFGLRPLFCTGGVMHAAYPRSSPFACTYQTRRCDCVFYNTVHPLSFWVTWGETSAARSHQQHRLYLHNM